MCEADWLLVKSRANNIQVSSYFDFELSSTKYGIRGVQEGELERDCPTKLVRPMTESDNV